MPVVFLYCEECGKVRSHGIRRFWHYVDNKTVAYHDEYACLKCTTYLDRYRAAG